MMLALSMVIALLALQGDSAQPARKPVRSVAAVDLDRYAGLWYEVARFPNSFQAKCRGQATATYERLPGGQLRVVNTCRGANGALIRAEGRARLADRGGPTSRLKVRFAPAILSFLPMVWGDYWILGLTADYGAALVGTPSRQYLWVLSRTPQMEDTTFQGLVATAAAQGFDVARLAKSP